ncbi:hypothetical protein SAMN05443248_0604 [Bradyrhizobium erythrophlei]|jgi:hypothetical protein|uniref:Uncharacterized protein n=1 Tax=Bradyrhizobium erythrophlei TaxID=1437360 RepID=A0A1M5HRV5_9BRAD|nr:hypothetical protein SAMN05443248_0604 [Bradyrhizobium erythrophlei]
MSRDPDNWYEEEYWEEIGRQEDLAEAIKNLSHQPIRDFLGTYGDAIDNRLRAETRFVTAEASSFIQIEAHCAVQRIAKRGAARPSWWAPRQVQVPGLVQIAGLCQRGRAR